HLAADLLDLRQGLGQRNLDALHALLEARQVLGQPERLAVIDADHFVDAVAELEPAVLDRNAGLLEWEILAVEIKVHDEGMIAENRAEGQAFGFGSRFSSTANRILSSA